jgi:NAD(P)H-dependent FMN reductase
MIKIGIIVGSTRVGRLGSQVADWVFKLANQRLGVTYEVIEIADYQLGMFEETAPTEGVKRWQDKIKSLDGFIFVTAEYNHTITASLKNALDYTLENWFNKAAGIVSYGYAGGTRAAEHLRSILGALHVADVRQHVTVSLVSEITKDGVLNPGSYQVPLLNTLLDQVEAWSKALQTIR